MLAFFAEGDALGVQRSVGVLFESASKGRVSGFSPWPLASKALLDFPTMPLLGMGRHLVHGSFLGLCLF